MNNKVTVEILGVKYPLRYSKDSDINDIQEDVQKNLSQIFNRDFTTAYLEKKQGKFMMSDKRPNNRGRLVGRVIRYDNIGLLR